MINENTLLDRYFYELLNNGDFSRAHEILAPLFVFYGPTTTGGLDSRGFKRFIEELRAAFSNKQFVELDRIEAGNRAVIRFRMTGTQDGAYHGIPPIGISVDVEGCDMIRLEHGKITEVRAYFDVLAILQRSLVPAPVRMFGEVLGKLWTARV